MRNIKNQGIVQQHIRIEEAEGIGMKAKGIVSGSEERETSRFRKAATIFCEESRNRSGVLKRIFINILIFD